MMLKSVLNFDAQKVLNKIAPDALKVPQECVLGVQKHPQRSQKASPEAPERPFGGSRAAKSGLRTAKSIKN